MNRRDFLLFRTDERRRVVELSCERLYMRFLDAQLTWGSGGEEPPAEGQVLGGEPPAALDFATPEQLFADLEGELSGADILRVREPQWLATAPLSGHVETLISSFTARGGQVEFVDMPPRRSCDDPES